jgi:hypothetical protein
LTAVATTARLGLNTVVNQEIAYIFSLQWFPFPLPPLPPLPFAATKVPAAAASKDAVAPAKPVVSSGTGHSARPQVVAPSTDAPATDTLAAAAVTDTTATASKTAKSNAANATSGKSGSAKSGSDAPKKKSTAGSARNHKTAD